MTLGTLLRRLAPCLAPSMAPTCPARPPLHRRQRTSLDDSIAALQAHAKVAWAQPMNEFRAQGHLHPLYALQPAAAQWHLDDLHALATGRRVRVAIIDSGVDDAHPDLAQAVQTRANFVDGQAWAPEPVQSTRARPTCIPLESMI